MLLPEELEEEPVVEVELGLVVGAVVGAGVEGAEVVEGA
jgi:hypothetical protein